MIFSWRKIATHELSIIHSNDYCAQWGTFHFTSYFLEITQVFWHLSFLLIPIKGKVRSGNILPLLKELFLRNWKIIAVLSSLPCHCDSSALKLLLSTTFATSETPSWIWRQLWRSNSKPRSTLWPDSPFRRVFLMTVKLWSIVLWLTVIILTKVQNGKE